MNFSSHFRLTMAIYRLSNCVFQGLVEDNVGQSRQFVFIKTFTPLSYTAEGGPTVVLLTVVVYLILDYFRRSGECFEAKIRNL